MLADGLGGHGDGGLAARCCVETIARIFGSKPSVSNADLRVLVNEADRAVAHLRLVERKPAGSMRTTLALLALCSDTARWVHVGDTRVYWFRDMVLQRRTRDHSVSELVAGLEDKSLAAPPDDTDRNRLLRVVGTGAGAQADIDEGVVALQTGDAFLLCSDGVWSLLPDADITAALSEAATPLEWCAGIEQRLKQRLEHCREEKADDYSMILGMVGTRRLAIQGRTANVDGAM